MKRILALCFSILFLWSCSKEEIPLDDAAYKIMLSKKISVVTNSMIQDAVNKEGMLDPNAIADEIEKINGVKTATVTPSGSSIHIKQENGGELTLLLVTMDDDRMFFETTKKSTSKSFLDEIKFSSDFITPNGDGKALILAPFQSVFQETLNYYKIWLEQAGYSVDMYLNEAASLDKFRGSFLDDYDIVYISTHGETTYLDGRYINFIMTGEIVSDQRDRSLNKEELKDYIVYGWSASQGSLERYSISPQWFRETSDNEFPNTWIFINACYSAFDYVEFSLANTFFKLGAVGFNGWMYSPNIWWASVVGATMLHYFSHGYSFEDASDIVRDNSLAGILNIRIPLQAIDIKTFIDKQNPDLQDPFYLIPPCIDNERNVYRTVKIGNQWWMAENLKTTKFKDGSNIPHVTNNLDWSSTTLPAYSWYNNDISNKNPYGALYNFRTITTGKLCPSGWRIPSIDDWYDLINSVEGKIVPREDVNTAGDELKEIGTLHWATTNENVTNSSGFTALPGGVRLGNGNFSHLNYFCYTWSSDYAINSYGTTIPYGFSIAYNNSDVHIIGQLLNYGYSVRCIKD